MPPKPQGDSSNSTFPSCSRTGVSLIYPLPRVVVEEFYANDRSLRIKRDKFKDNSLGRISVPHNNKFLVVVVGVIGKTEDGKSKLLNSLLDRPIFNVIVPIILNYRKHITYEIFNLEKQIHK